MKLAEAVARYYHKLLAYKDEYEVARLHANGEFEKKIADMFEGNFKTTTTSRRRFSRKPTR